MSDAMTFIESDLTVADMEDFKEATGVALKDALAGIDEGEQEDTVVLTGLIWIVARRDKPGMTFEEARHVPLSTLEVGQTREQRRARPTKATPKKSGAKSKTASKRSASRR